MGKINIYEKRKGIHGKGRQWTAKDIQHLCDLSASCKTLDEVAENLGRTVYAVRKKASALSIKISHKRARPIEWTAEELAVLERQWLAGTTTELIAVKMGRTFDSVRAMAKATKLPKRTLYYEASADIQEKYEAGVPISQIAKEYRVSVKTLRKRIGAHHFRRNDLTELEEEIIEERLHDGCTLKCIAHRIRRSYGTVHRHVSRMESISEDVGVLIHQLKKVGLTADQIAIKLELPRRSINRAIKEIRERSDA